MGSLNPLNAVKKVTGAVFGSGDKTANSTVDVAPRSKEEELLLQQLIKSANRMPDTSQIGPSDVDQQIQNLFRTNVSNFLAKRSDGTVDPNALKSATAFIDQTFTAPAEQQLQMAQSDYASQLGAQQAALGRSGTDSEFQKNLFQSLANQRAQLGSQRGAMIQDYVLNQPGRDIQTGLQGLSGIGQIQQQNAFKPAFLNQLNQQAFLNRTSLMNTLSNQRFQAAGKTVTESGPNTGLLGSLSAIGSFGKDITNAGGISGIAKSAPGAIKGILGI